MSEIFRQGLIITGIGMGLVFIMVFLLWGIMALLVWLTNPREKAADKGKAIEAEETTAVAQEPVTAAQSTDEDELQRLAAAIAVAFAVKQPHTQTLASQTAPMDQGSAWLSVGRAQQMLTRNRGRN